MRARKQIVEQIRQRRKIMSSTTLNSDAKYSLYSKRGSSYDPMARANDFEFDSELFTDELLSQFDTEEAAALRLMEENVFDDICESEVYEGDMDNDAMSEHGP
jgi:hypothetical protein